MPSTPRLIAVVGSPGSGKDILVRAVNDMGSQHAQIVPKHTSRDRRSDDGREMICPGDPGFGLDRCDIVYENYGTKYGVRTSRVWRGLRSGVSQVLVVSNCDALNRLREKFGELLVVVYVHSQVRPEDYKRKEQQLGKDSGY